MMTIERIVVGPLQTNCYLVWPEDDAPGGLVIDPGAEGERIAGVCSQNNVNPVLAVNTHAHYDHIGANAELKRLFPGIRFAVGELDAASLNDPMRNLSAGFGIPSAMPAADQTLQDGEELELGACRFRVLHTPGHTGGAITLISDDASPPAVFCGDLLFADGVGRTDLPGGSAGDLRDSISRLLASCPDNAVIYPGHGPSITVGERRML